MLTLRLLRLLPTELALQVSGLLLSLLVRLDRRLHAINILQTSHLREVQKLQGRWVHEQEGKPWLQMHAGKIRVQHLPGAELLSRVANDMLEDGVPPRRSEAWPDGLFSGGSSAAAAAVPDELSASAVPASAACKMGCPVASAADLLWFGLLLASDAGCFAALPATSRLPLPMPW